MAPRSTSHATDTIGHEILDLEAQASVVDDAMYRMLDDLLDEARATISVGKMPTDREARKHEVGRVLAIIDDILIRKNVIYPRNRKEDWTLALRDALTPVRLQASDLDEILSQRHNRRRVDRIHRDQPFYLADCDTASFLYLAIADVLHLPLNLVDLPEHNFIRWSFDDNSYVNWETMYGEFRTNAEYRMFVDDDDLAEELYNRHVYLRAMTRKDTLGYCYSVRGLMWEDSKKYGRPADYKRAISDYKRSRKLYGRTPLAPNNEAWLLATAPDAAVRDGRRALTLALQVTHIQETANFLDTLAAAYAESGDFTSAALVEDRAFQRSGDPLYAELRDQAYRQHKTYARYVADKNGRGDHLRPALPRLLLRGRQ